MSIPDNNPVLLVNGSPVDDPKKPEEHCDELPAIRDDTTKSLDELLRKYKTEGIHKQRFWSLRLLQHILSRDRVLKELNKSPEIDAVKYVDFIRPEVNSTSGSPTYLKVFALLVLQERGDKIVNFVHEKISDQSLPFQLQYGIEREKVELASKYSPKARLKCFKGWKKSEKELFLKNQWEVLVPYFELDAKSLARNYPLDDNTILPWCTEVSKSEGGFAYVSCVKIDPLSHGFHNILKAISLNNGLFALKVLHQTDWNDEKRFDNECTQLRRFNGRVHSHLVTLLASFTLHARWNFLFPYAQYALDSYWEEMEPRPIWDVATVRWVAKQLSGIIGAIDTIHNPIHLHQEQVEKGFGRHGDIKPDNILWFNSTTDHRGILVVSDFGLAAFHRDKSRSNIPNKGIPAVPGYRPPECDISGGTISRAYDIWTLGCLFLELLTWLLGGQDLLKIFNQNRNTIFLLTGAKNTIFFTLLKTENPGIPHVAQVKPEVTKWFETLHNYQNCSQFIHEALDIIQYEMLVILSRENQRSASTTLRRKFEGLYKKCQDTSKLEYCTAGVRPSRLFKAQTAVIANLNDNAKRILSETKFDVEIEKYTGKTDEPMPEEELKNIDGHQTSANP